MGAIGCLWLGARRSGHALLSALAYPAIGLMLVTVMLAYSRGALVALAIGTIAWMALVPLRLRGVRVLAVGAIAAAPVVAWNFSESALKDEGVGLAARTTAGHQFGVLLAAMLLLLLLAGAAIGFFGDRRAGWAGSNSGTRRAAGYAIAALLALAIAGAFGALAMSSRGLTGTISHDLSSLTDPNARVPNTAARLTAASSVRARYWKEAVEIFEAHPALGSGAAGYETARLRYRTVPIDVRQAHGYIVQTLADLGIAGLALTLALFFAWMAATGRATHPFNRRWSARRRPEQERSEASVLRLRPPSFAWRSEPRAYTPERIGLLSMLCIVVTFGVHSFVDWTWYVPGDALVALLCAGWLAGRGPLPHGNLLAPAGSPQADASTPRASSNGSTSSRAASSAAPDTASGANSGAALDAATHADPHAATQANPGTGSSPHRPARVEPMRIALALLVVAGALLAAWTEWQPQRSVDASEQALALLRRNPVAALSAAQAAVQRDPLSATALFRLAAVQHETGQKELARSTLQKAVRMQPSNPETWSTLGEYDMHTNPSAAVRELRAAVYLDPQSVPLMNVYVEALRAAGPTAIAKAEAEATSAAQAPKGATNSRTTNSSRAGTRTPVQNRERRALASNTARAPGTPPAPRSSTSSKR
jgi:hypothetical protein